MSPTAAGSGAVLTGVVVGSLGQGADERLDVGIVEDDDRRLAAQFEVHALEGVGRVPRDELAGVHVTGDRHHRHLGVTDQRVASGLSLAGHDVEHAVGEDVRGDLGELERRERRQLARLQDEGVAGGEGRAQLPDGHVERVVPRGDADAHAERVAAQHGGVVLQVLAGRLGLHGAGGTREEAEVVDSQVELEVDDRHRLADVDHLQTLELVQVGLDGVGQGEQLLRAFPGSRPTPRLERGGGGGDGGVGVGGAARSHLLDDLPGRRVDHVVRCPVPGVAPLSPDEVLSCHVPSVGSGRPGGHRPGCAVGAIVPRIRSSMHRSANDFVSGA